MPKVSILVPVFNVERYLKQCLDSIIDQSLRDIEIICINDGSTDSSLKIIKQYARKDPRVVLIDKKNSGYGDSMNRGIQRATGQYIGIVESDDWIESDTFEKLLRLADLHDAEVVKSNFYNYFSPSETHEAKSTIVDIMDPHDIDHVVDTSNGHSIMWQQPSIWSAIYKKSFLEKHGINFLATPGASYQDTSFSFKVWANAVRVVFTDAAYLHYRQDNEQSSINDTGKVFCVADEYAEIEQYLKRTHKFEKLKDIMYSTKWGGYRWNIERLTPATAKPFILRASKEYHDAYVSGDFNLAHFDVNASREIQELMRAPSQFLQRKKARSTAKVAVIIPVYNVHKYLKRCLDSVVSQTLVDIEIIAIDDGSTDQSPEILEEYYINEHRLVICNTVNRGLSAARNRGLELARAPYITFCDSDDYFNPGTVSDLYSAITMYKTDAATGSSHIVYETSSVTALDKNIDRQYYTTKYRGVQKVTDAILSKTDISVWDKIFRKEIIDKHSLRFPEGLMYEDAYFTHVYLWLSDSLYFLPPDKPVYNYVRRPGSIMAETNPDAPYRYDHLSIVELLFEFLKQNDLFSEHAPYFACLYKNYLELTLNGSAPEHHEYTYNRTRQFLESQKEYITSINASSYEDMLALLPIKKLSEDEPSPIAPIQEVKPPATLKHAAHKLVSKISPAYRSSYHTSIKVAEVSRQLSTLETDQRAATELIEATNTHVDELTRKFDRLRRDLQQ